MASHPLHEQGQPLALGEGLLERVAEVGRQARWWLLAMAASVVCITFVGAGFVSGAADYLLRFEDRGLRTALSLVAPICTIAAAWLFLWPALFARRSEQEVARRIERYFPALRGRLTSALEFLRVDDADAKAGSLELRRQTIAETARTASSLPLREALDTLLPRFAAILAGAACLFAIAICALAPAEVALAARRLTAPWGGDAWPRRNDLKFVDPPARIAVGDDLELVVVDANGRLPRRVTFEYRYGAGPIHLEPMQNSGDDRMIVRLNNIGESMAYRATGGDHVRAPWRRIEAVAPPQLVTLDVTIHPPAYTGHPSRQSTTSIRALAGSRIDIRGVANQPLSAATLHMETPSQTRQWPLVTKSRKRAFSIEQNEQSAWIVRESGKWRLRLVNEQGIALAGKASDDITAIPDEPPSIGIENDAESAFITPRAVVPLLASVKDDLAVAAVRLEYAVVAEPANAPQSIEIFHGPPQASPHEGGEELTVEHRWDISQIEGVAPGQTVAWMIVAEDYLGQSSRSSEQKLTVVSDDDLESRLQARQTRLFASLAEALRGQSEARDLTNALTTAPTGEAIAERVGAAELAQSEVKHRLGAAAPGAAHETALLISAYADNRLAAIESPQRLSTLLASLRGLQGGELPAIEEGLLELARAETAESTGPLVERIVAGQTRVIDELERQLGQLTDWDNYRRFARDLGRLRQDQSELLDETLRRRLAALGQGAQDAAAAELRADLARLGKRELNLANQFDKIRTRMEQMHERLNSDKPADAENAGALSEAIEASRRTAIAGSLREAARALDAMELGQAVESQQQALAGLDELLDILSQRRRNQLQTAAAQLRAAREDIDRLAQAQQSVREEIERAGDQAELAAAAPRQEAIAAEFAALAEALRQSPLRSPGSAADAVRGAENHARAAASAASEARGDEASDAARRAEAALARAGQSLESQLHEAEQQLAEERLSLLASSLSSVLSRQQKIAQEIEGLAAEAPADGRLNRASLARLAAQAVAEEELAGETLTIGEPLDDAPAIAHAIGAAASAMQRAASLWRERDIGPSGRRAAQDAIDRLSQVLAAIKPPPPAAPSPTGEPANSGDPASQAEPRETTPANNRYLLAQLKVLLLAQQAINQRTSELESSGGDKAELAALANEQIELAKLLEALATPANEGPKSP